jgi:hypothetical protein
LVERALKRPILFAAIHLKVSVDDEVDLEILVVVAPRIEQRFRNLDPAKVSDELDDGEDREVSDCKIIRIKIIYYFLDNFFSNTHIYKGSKKYSHFICISCFNPGSGPFQMPVTRRNRNKRSWV